MKLKYFFFIMIFFKIFYTKKLRKLGILETLGL